MLPPLSLKRVEDKGGFILTFSQQCRKKLREKVYGVSTLNYLWIARGRSLAKFFTPINKRREEQSFTIS